MKSTVRHIALPLLIGILLLFVPLLRDLHIESAMLAAVIGCFWAAWNACKNTPGRNDISCIGSILIVLYTAGVPIFLFSLIAGCLSWSGIAFWILYPVPSVLLGYSIGRIFRIYGVPYRQAFSIIILLFIAIGVLLIEFFTLPQVYFFNHVWGGWPGPIYDETVMVSWRLIFYRGMTLAWVGILWWLPSFRSSMKSKVAVVLCGLLLIVGYTQLAEMGIISPRQYLQEQLGGEKKTAHFTLYYDQSHYTADEIGFIAKKHEFYFQQIVEALDLSPDDFNNIESYLYAHPWQKKKLVGAKFTSYVPVWLDQDQLHIAKPQIGGSLKHELVHVLSKQFGNRLFNASWSIGLIEGLAVAIDPSASSESTINQIVVSEKPYPTIDEMYGALSLRGFWGGRSAVNYTQTGSFVQYLLQNYPITQFKQAYQTGAIAASYQTSLGDLVSGWHGKLDTVTVDSTDKQVAERLYGFPSLFEQECPHVQSAFAQQWDLFRFSLAEEDTIKALQHLEKAHRYANDNLLVKTRWAYLNLKMGNIDKVQEQANKADSSAEALMLYADALKLNGEPEKAQAYIVEAAQRVQQSPGKETKAALHVRLDSVQWNYHRAVVYEQVVAEDSIFIKMDHRTQVRAMRGAIMRGQDELLKRYGHLIDVEKLKPLYLDTYIDAIEQLAYSEDITLARRWLDVLESIELRLRYKERINQAREFIIYVHQH